jgi:hypothetical protein
LSISRKILTAYNDYDVAIGAGFDINDRHYELFRYAATSIMHYLLNVERNDTHTHTHTHTHTTSGRYILKFNALLVVVVVVAGSLIVVSFTADLVVLTLRVARELLRTAYVLIFVDWL